MRDSNHSMGDCPPCSGRNSLDMGHAPDAVMP